jgi:hypothetical protein
MSASKFKIGVPLLFILLFFMMRRTLPTLTEFHTWFKPIPVSSLALSSGTIELNRSVSLDLTLTSSGDGPAGLQWMLSYAPVDVSSVSIAAGPALTAAGKTLNCITAAGSSTCLAVGRNPTPIAGGVVAVVTVTLASAPSTSAVPIAVGNMIGVLADGTALSVTGAGGTIIDPDWQAPAEPPER